MTPKEEVITPTSGTELIWLYVNARVVYGPPHRCFFRGKEYDDHDQWVEDVWAAIQSMLRSQKRTSR